MTQYATLLSFFLQTCVEDTRSSIKIELDFSQENIEDAAAVLNVDSNQQAMIEVFIALTTSQEVVATMKMC